MTQQILNPSQLPNADGWTPVTDTWTYASATSITVPSGAAAIYQKGQKFKVTANSVVLQGWIIGVADTLLTVVGDTLTNHAFSNCNYSNIESPFGFPSRFSYTPVVTSAGTPPTYTLTNAGYYSISGGFAHVQIHLQNSSGGTPGSGANHILVSIPVECNGGLSAGSGTVYEVGGKFCAVIARVGGSKTVYMHDPTFNNITCDDQSGAARYIGLTFTYSI